MADRNVSAVILAAGASTRMGSMKQLLTINGSFMLEHVIQKCLSLPFEEVIVVIGYRAQLIKELITIEDNRLSWVVNNDYDLGQSTSLKSAVKNMKSQSNTMMVFLGDQPTIQNKTTGMIYQKGLECLEGYNTSFVVQPHYHNHIGHPVFFGHYEQINFMEILGDQGARKIIQNMGNRILLPVNDKGIVFDVDTPEDYDDLIEQT